MANEHLDVIFTRNKSYVTSLSGMSTQPVNDFGWADFVLCPTGTGGLILRFPAGWPFDGRGPLTAKMKAKWEASKKVAALSDGNKALAITRPIRAIGVEDNCESIDAAVFSGDMLWNGDDRAALKAWCERWLRAIHDHQVLADEEEDSK